MKSSNFTQTMSSNNISKSQVSHAQTWQTIIFGNYIQKLLFGMLVYMFIVVNTQTYYKADHTQVNRYITNIENRPQPSGQSFLPAVSLEDDKNKDKKITKSEPKTDKQSIKENNNTKANKTQYPSSNEATTSSNGTFYADLTEGVIGYTNENGSDSPQDNVFNVLINAPVDKNGLYELKYEVYGVEGIDGVSKSINERVAKGGYLVKKNEGWSEVKEIVKGLWLTEGINSIRYGKSEGYQYEYKIKNVVISKVSDKDLQNKPFILNTKRKIAYTDDGKIYLSGLYHHQKCDQIIIGEGENIMTEDGEFEVLYTLTENEKAHGKLQIQSKSGGQITHEEILELVATGKHEDYSEVPVMKEKGVEREISSDREEKLSIDGASIKTVHGAMAENTVISIRPLMPMETAPLNQGMINVTKGKKAYRFLPHGMQFKSEILLEIPYDSTLIPEGYSPLDIQSFFFDEVNKTWQAVQVDSILLSTGTVWVKTNHFTDYINGIIQVPESPATNAFAPTTMSEMKAADPMAGVNMMAPPSASQKGEASLSYPINIPPGRRGMQPNIQLTYSSDGGSGWLGLGWNIAVPSITVDNRWGAPIFSTSLETEIYMLNGQQLIASDKYMPNRHDEGTTYTTTLKSRTAAPARFYERKLGSFSKIERHGSLPANYYWVVTTADGVVHTYGTAGCTIGSTNGIATWYLKESVDKYGNNVKYEYQPETINSGPAEGGRHIYPRRIKYTGHAGGDGNFTIEFNTNPGIVRKDVVINAKNGYKDADFKQLDNIQVKMSGTTFREYRFSYTEGIFFKTLLQKIEEYVGGQLFHDHEMQYHQDATNCSIFSADPSIVPLPTGTPSNCGSTDTDGDGIFDLCDNCPNVYNPLQEPDCVQTNCGVLDSDGDGIKDGCDNCPNTANPTQTDTDGDGIGDACDNCITHWNHNQSDRDGDGKGDVCDSCPNYYSSPANFTADNTDTDNDGKGAACDNCPNAYNPLQADVDKDGVGDGCDNCPMKENPGQYDGDGDNVGYVCDNCPYINNPNQDSVCSPILPNPPPTPSSNCRTYRIKNLGIGDSIRYTTCDGITRTFIITFPSYNEETPLFCARVGTITTTGGPGNIFEENIPCISDGCQLYYIDPNVVVPIYGPYTVEYFGCGGGGSFMSISSGQGAIRFCAPNYTPKIVCQNGQILFPFGVGTCGENGGGGGGSFQGPVAGGSSFNGYGHLFNTPYSDEWAMDWSKKLRRSLDFDDLIKERNEALLSISSIENSGARNNLNLSNILSSLFLIKRAFSGYFPHLSALGTNSSSSTSIGVGGGIGIGCKPKNKGGSVTITGSINWGWDKSKGELGNIDMNGDGLPDLVKKENDGNIRYYPHIVQRTPGANGDNITHSFAPTGITLTNIPSIYKDFYRSSGKNRTTEIGLTVALLDTIIGGHGGVSTSKASTTSDIYFTDGNGDGLPDLALNGNVFFNTIDRSTGTSNFTISSVPTENLIVSGETLNDTLTIPDVDLNVEFPAYDVVKTWEAPHDGHVIIKNGVITTNAKISIETDNNGFYGYGIHTQKGTCRLYRKDTSDMLVDTIKFLPVELSLGCTTTPGVIDACTSDSDGDGINDCLDCGNTTDEGCENCPINTLVHVNVPSDTLSMEKARDTVTAINTILAGGEAVYHGGHGVLMTYGTVPGGLRPNQIGERSILADSGFGVETSGEYLAYAGGCEENKTSGGVNIAAVPNGLQSTIRVKKGQKIYFRTHVKRDSMFNNSLNPEIGWDPQVIYTKISGVNINHTEKDQDGITPHKSKYSEGFMLKQNSETIGGASGQGSKVKIEWPAFSLAANSDEIRFKISKEPENSSTGPSVIWDYILPVNSLPTIIGLNSPLEIYMSNSEKAELKFEVISTSNVDWQAIKWHPVIYMDMYETAGDTSNRTPVTIVPVVNYHAYKPFVKKYDATNQTSWKSYNNINIQDDGGNKYFYLYPGVQSSITSNFTSCNGEEGCDTGKVYMVVKQNGVKVGARTVLVTNAGIGYDVSGPLLLMVTDSASKFITIELSGDGKHYSNEMLRILESNSINVGYNLPVAWLSESFQSSGIPSDAKKITRRNVILQHLTTDASGQYYRGWGQFMYDEKQDSINMAPGDPFGKLINTKEQKTDSLNSGQIIAFEDLELTDFNTIEPENLFNEESQSVTGISGLNGLKMPSRLFFYPVAKKSVVQSGNGAGIREVWMAGSAQNYAARYSARAIGMQEIFRIQTGDTLTTTQFAGVNTGAYSVNKISASKSRTVHFGVSAGAFGLGKMRSLYSYSESLSDYTDLNGDRYPDAMSNSRVQMTNPTGGLFAMNFSGPGSKGGIRNWNGNFGRDTIKTGGLNGAVSGTYGKSAESAPSNSKFRKFLQSSKEFGPIGVSGQYTSTNSSAQVLWTDINGDGLNDRLIYNGDTLKVRLNFGLTGEDDSLPKPWGKIALNKNENNSFGLGLGITFGKGFSGTVGLSAGMSKADPEGLLIDMNGDGLPDYYGKYGGNDKKIIYNTGNGFAVSDSCQEFFDFKDNAESVSNGLNFAFTAGPVIPIIFKCIKISLHVNASILNKSHSNTKKTVQDYDGDGYPDLVVQEDNCDLKVYHSKIRRTNKLKMVTLPTGGQYMVDYQLAPPTYDMPNSKWVMSKVDVKDPYVTATEGASTVTTEFAYHNGKYDRRERDFYGFEYVRTMNKNDQGIYRQNIAVYHNKSYYLNGMMKESYVVNGSSGVTIVPAPNTLKNDSIHIANSGVFTKSVVNTELRLPITGIPIWTMGSAPGDGNNYDIGGTKGLGAAFPIIVSKENIVYELGAGTLSSTETMTYDPHGRVTQVVKGGNGNSFTTTIEYYTAYQVPDIVSVPKIITVSAPGAFRKREVSEIDAATGMPKQIDVYYTGTEFNRTKLTYDAYGNLQTKEHPQLPGKTPLIQTYGYDGLIGNYITSVSDNYLFNSSATYDVRFGNMLTSTDITSNVITYQYDNFGRMTEVKGPKDPVYTIRFAYNLTKGKSHATTEHYDRQNPGDPITTVTISNGLGQPVQVKKDVSVYSNGSYSGGMSASGNATKDQYGRVVTQYHPVFQAGGGTGFVPTSGVPSSSVTYDAMDRPLTATDAAGTVTTMSYSIADGALRTITNTPQKAGVIMVHQTYKDLDGRLTKTNDNGKVTQFAYDGVGQLLNSTDEDGKVTTSIYDAAGRRTSWTHPDAGTTLFGYDKLGRVDSIITANLSAQGKSVIYKYDALGRPEEVKYPTVGGVANVNNVKYEYWPTGTAGNNKGRLKLQEDGTGAQEFEYGNMGEVIKHTRTIIAPGQSTKTFEHRYVYDSWGRVDSMVYPGGENMRYLYDAGGNLKIMVGTDSIIKAIGYDHYGQKVYCKYGNGTENIYTYSPQLRRLTTLQAKSSTGTSMLNNSYAFDLVGNVDSIKNTAGAVGLLGGGYTHRYSYDIFNRLTSANGSWTGVGGQPSGSNNSSSYTLAMAYQNMHRITSKTQSHTRDGASVPANTYTNVYTYGNTAHPNAVTAITNGANTETFTYDANGNTLTHNNPAGENKTMLWDESNMLKAIRIADQSLQHYIYDAHGERTLKGKGNVTVVSVNGVPQSTTATIGNYTIYESGYIVVGPNGYVTKHYYNGSERVSSRLGGSVSGYLSGAAVGGAETASLPSRQQADLTYVFGQFGLGTVTVTNQPPAPGDCEVAGNCASNLYYFHPDHVGSSTFLSDQNGQPYQFLLYLPFGESMASQKAGGWATPYKFNGKELDDETGMYDYGARYYDPRLSMWHGVDPLAENFPSWSPYNYTMNNPINLIDPDGRRPFPVNSKYKGEKFRIDSWFGPRNTGLSYASKFHKGLDFNFGGGRFDYGAPVLTTHTGTVTIKDNKKGNAGRMVTVTSPDGSFRTRYLHLKDINVKDGDNITEGTQIGELGGSRAGKEYGGNVHLHYEIQKYNSETKTWDPYNPTEGNGNSKDNVVDPQTWITPEPTKDNDMFTPIPMAQDNTRVNIVLPIKKEEIKTENP